MAQLNMGNDLLSHANGPLRSSQGVRNTGVLSMASPARRGGVAGDLRRTSMEGRRGDGARGRRGQFVTVMFTPELKALPVELKASDKSTYEPFATDVVFQLKSHP